MTVPIVNCDVRKAAADFHTGEVAHEPVSCRLGVSAKSSSLGVSNNVSISDKRFVGAPKRGLEYVRRHGCVHKTHKHANILSHALCFGFDELLNLVGYQDRAIDDRSRGL